LQQSLLPFCVRERYLPVSCEPTARALPPVKAAAAVCSLAQPAASAPFLWNQQPGFARRIQQDFKRQRNSLLRAGAALHQAEEKV